MKFRILFLSCLCIFCFNVLSAQNKTKKKERFNWGLRAGVNAPFVDIRESRIDGIKIEEPSANSKMGLLISMFSRININRHYLQLEAETHYSRYRITPRTDSEEAIREFGHMEGLTISNKIYSLDIPLLYGYNFIKQGPYELSFFAGPKFKYLYKRDSDISVSEPYEIIMDERMRPFTANFVLGLGTSISRLFIDFRYEFGITDLTRPTTYTLYKDGANISEGSIYLKRGINLLSFSIGIIL